MGDLFVFLHLYVSSISPLYFFWVNYIWSNSETRRKELVTVEKYKESSRYGGIDMIIRFEDGCKRTVNYDSEHDLRDDDWNRYEIGTTLPVTMERGFFGIDVIVEWGFENAEYTNLLPDLEEMINSTLSPAH